MNNWREQLWGKIVALTITGVFLFSEVTFAARADFNLPLPKTSINYSPHSTPQNNLKNILHQLYQGITLFLTPSAFAGDIEFYEANKPSFRLPALIADNVWSLPKDVVVVEQEAEEVDSIEEEAVSLTPEPAETQGVEPNDMVNDTVSSVEADIEEVDNDEPAKEAESQTTEAGNSVDDHQCSPLNIQELIDNRDYYIEQEDEISLEPPADDNANQEGNDNENEKKNRDEDEQDAVISPGPGEVPEPDGTIDVGDGSADEIIDSRDEREVVIPPPGPGEVPEPDGTVDVGDGNADVNSSNENEDHNRLTTNSYQGIYNCAVNALYELLQHKVSKDDITEFLAQLEHSPPVAGTQTSLASLQNAAEYFGLDYQALKTTYEALLATNQPFIAHLNNSDQGHFVLVTQITDDTVTYMDNGVEKTVSREEFESQWSGYVLSEQAEGKVLSEDEAKEVKGASSIPRQDPPRQNPPRQNPPRQNPLRQNPLRL